LRKREIRIDTLGVAYLFVALFFDSVRLYRSVHLRQRFLAMSKQWRLLALISGAQLLCLVIGLTWFSSWLRQSVVDAGRIQILQANETFASFLARSIEEEGVDDLTAGSQGLSRLQSLVGSVRLPNRGLVCIVDNQTGGIVAHPSIEDRPNLRSSSVFDVRLISSDGTKSLGEICRDPDALATSGFAKMDGEMQIIAVQPLKGLEATLMVRQQEANVATTAESLLLPVWNIGLGVATLITLLGLTVVSFVLQKYEDRLAQSNLRLEQLVNIRTKSLVKTRNAIIFGLAKLAESRDTDTGEHLERIRRYVTILSRRLAKRDRSIDNHFIANLALASSLHDIGKVGIPDAVLLKPGRLDDQEREIIEQHPIIGRQCLEAIQRQLGSDDFLEMARMIAESHHEKWDGGGYPRNLSGEEIPLVGRIVALADVYDALTTKRPYKEAMSHAKATQIIVDGKGSHFDPRIVEAFLASHLEFESIAKEFAEGNRCQWSGGPPLATDPDVDALLSPAAHV
jgi:response regulator RpfG family c-di-GMP phosphodiesterase